MNPEKFDLSVPMPSEASGAFLSWLGTDVCKQLRDLDIKGRQSGRKVLRMFYYHGIIHWDNREYLEKILDLSYDMMMTWRRNKTISFEFVHHDVFGAIVNLPLKKGQGPTKITEPVEFERFKVQAEKYPVTITFRLELDDYDADLELTIHDGGWHFPGNGTLICAKNRITIESNTNCNVFMSWVYRDSNPNILEQMNEACVRQSYKVGFRPTIQFPVP